MKLFRLTGIFICVFFNFIFCQTVQTDLIYKINKPSQKIIKSDPVLILLHGYGSNENDLVQLSNYLNQNFTIFSLRAPIPLNNDRFCWFNLEFLANQEFKYDYKETIESRIKVLKFISNACKTFQLDSTNVFLIGFSQGAFMSYDIALSNPTKLKGIVALSGKLMEESFVLESNALRVLKVFIAHGIFDKVVKNSDSEKAYVFLKNKKIKNLTLKTYQIKHGINQQELFDVKAWLDKAK